MSPHPATWQQFTDTLRELSTRFPKYLETTGRVEWTLKDDDEPVQLMQRICSLDASLQAGIAADRSLQELPAMMRAPDLDVIMIDAEMTNPSGDGIQSNQTSDRDLVAWHREYCVKSLPDEQILWIYLLSDAKALERHR
jgi:hypothetical protein